MFRKSGIIFYAVLLIMSACKNETSNDKPENALDPAIVHNPQSASPDEKKDLVPVLKFNKEVHDFGTITQGEKVSFTYLFENVGKADLIIRAAQGSCGCTVPEFPKDPIPPGKGGSIKVTFDSEGKEGQQEKTVTVISNTIPNNFVLTIKANIVKP